MSSKRNQTIAIARFLMYKYGLNQQLEGMTDEEYLAHPIGLEVGQYVADLMKYCPEHIVDQVMEHQDALLRRMGTDYLTVIAYEGQSMRDGRPNPDIWGNIITCGEIAVGIYEIVGTKKRGLEVPKAVAEEILPESVVEQAAQDGESLCFTDPASNAIVADALLEQELVTDPQAVARLDAIRQLDDVAYDTAFEPPVSDYELDGLDLER